MGQFSTSCGSLNFSNCLIIVHVIALVLFSSLHAGHGAHILFVNGLSSHSHRVAMQPLANKLSEKGHHVTFLSPFKPEVDNPKIKEFCPKVLKSINEQLENDLSTGLVTSRFNDKYEDTFFNNFGSAVFDMGVEAAGAILNSPDFHEWIETLKFDLIITEHPFKEIFIAIAQKYGAKIIGFSPCPMVSSELDMFGIPTESSWLPDLNLGGGYSQYIPDRFSYEFNHIMWYFKYRWSYLPKINSIIQNVYKNGDMPHVVDLIKNINLLFVNTHYSNEFARSLPPFVVPVGGMHAQESKNPLPKNIDDFITSGTEGFVYISFGSFVTISALPENVTKHFFDVIKSFPNARFLMKWSDEIPKDMPKNVLPMKWFPQQDILAHPNCRGFVSQGGLMSFQQATYHGVPVIITPVFCDQPYNARIAAQKGNGIYLELADINFDTLSDAIGQLLYNDTLSTQAKEIAKIFKDRPMSPVDTAVWWTEYVLRHNDTSHLKPLGIRQEWWQRRLLDFWAIVFTTILLVSLVIIWTIRSSIRLCLKYFKKAQGNVKIKRS